VIRRISVTRFFAVPNDRFQFHNAIDYDIWTVNDQGRILCLPVSTTCGTNIPMVTVIEVVGFSAELKNKP
jgi:hypothetical protein